jgi:hypothetical protein
MFKSATRALKGQYVYHSARHLKPTAPLELSNLSTTAKRGTSRSTMSSTTTNTNTATTTKDSTSSHPSSSSPDPTVTSSTAESQHHPHQPLPLPAPPADHSEGGATQATQLEVNGDGIRLDHLGPMVVNADGTLSRIDNWAQMTEIERRNTLRVLGKRNRERMEALKAKEGSQ